MSQPEKGKTKSYWTSIQNKKLKVLLCTLCAFPILVWFSTIARQRVQPYTFYAQLLVYDKTLAQPDFAVVNCSDAVMSAFYSPVSTRSLTFLQL